MKKEGKSIVNLSSHNQGILQAPGCQCHKDLKELNYIKNLDIFRKAPFPECIFRF